MNIEQASKVIKISADEARVAIAFLGDGEARRLLLDQVKDKLFSRGVLRVELSNHNLDNSDDAIRALNPGLFSYDLPFEQRVPLIGAFVIGIEGQNPSVPLVLEGMDPEQRAEIAITARDALLAM